MQPNSVISFATGLLLISAPAAAGQYAYTSIEVRCEVGATACPAGLAPGGTAAQTSVRGINAGGDMVGFYTDAAAKQHGFLLKDGVYTTIDFPLGGVRGTIANGINPQGEIVGQFVLPVNAAVPEDSPLFCPANLASGAASPACTKAFHYRRGDYTSFTFTGHPGSIAQRITANGEIFGCLHDRDLGMSMFGAAWQRSLGPRGSVQITDAFSLLADGGEQSAPMDVPMSMNNGGSLNAQSVAGFFTDMSGQQRGYLVRDGVLEPYDAAPDAAVTAIWDMNPAGHFVGTFRSVTEAAARRHGYIDRGDGSAPVTFDVTLPGTSGNTVTAFATIAFGVNPDGVIVGQYTLVTGGTVRGFVARPLISN